MTRTDPIDEVLASLSPGEGRYALKAGGRIVEFLIDRGDAAAGSVILGRVLEVNRNLHAAFVDIGEALPGFLPGIQGLSQGLAVLVQVAAPARRAKGAVLTREVSLQGRWLAFTPARPGLSLSRKIADPARREALGTLLKSHLAAAEGLVVRTAAAGAGDDDLTGELTALRETWRQVAEASSGRAPCRLRSVPPLVTLLGEGAATVAVWADDAGTLAALRPDFPNARLNAGIFACEAEDPLEQALAPRVPLAGGGALVIEATQAFTAIDIDAGGGQALSANLAAMPEVARQIRLRNLVGHILVDVIPLKDRDARGRVLASLKNALAADPVPTQLVGTTPLGLVEILRERRRSSLAEMLLDEPQAALSSRSIALAGLRALVREALARPSARLALAASPEVLSWLRRDPVALAEAGRRLGEVPALCEKPDLRHFRIIEVGK